MLNFPARYTVKMTGDFERRFRELNAKQRRLFAKKAKLILAEALKEFDKNNGA